MGLIPGSAKGPRMGPPGENERAASEETDKRDKGATRATPGPQSTRSTASPSMDAFSPLLQLLLLLIATGLSGAHDYKLCATQEYEPLCKWIEASRNEITCVKVSDSVDCLLKMQKKEADFGTFFPEEAFLAARFLGEAAIVLAEVRHPDRADRSFNFETVAVVRPTLFGGLSALKGLSYCHPGFTKAQYWSDRVLKDFEKRVLDHFKDDIKCNSAVRSAYEDDLHRLSTVFGRACRPGVWAVSDWWDKKLKREYHSLCEQCEHPNTCSYAIQNKGRHSDALRCLTLRGGNVTYTALEFVQKYFDLESDEVNFSESHKDSSRYNFLCPDGSTRPLTSSDPCSWIKQHWTSVIALKDVASDMLKNLKEWLETEKPLTWTNHLRNILVKGNGVLKFKERPVAVAGYISEGRKIPSEENETCRQPVRWCAISELEKKKCDYISAAALVHGLPTRLQCVQGKSRIDCLHRIRSREADIVYVDSELGYISRKVHNLTATAYLETQRTGNYYGVAVVKGNSVKKFKDLRGKRGCFPQYNGLGWLTFVEALKFHSAIPARSCSDSKKVWNYLSEVCAPGSRDPDFNPDSAKASDKLCRGCTNAAEGGSCEAIPENPYYGEIGAFRCLNNNDGDVAFLDFNTVQKYLVSNRQSANSGINWNDFKILCRDGSLESFNLTNPDKCSFIQVNGGEVVIRSDLDPVFKTDISHTLMELDDLFGTTSRTYNPALKMFEPFDGEANLLFKESAVSLVSVFETQNRFVNNYMNLLNSLESCLSGVSTFVPSLLVVAFSLFFVFLHQ